jgi:hypothetical protein
MKTVVQPHYLQIYRVVLQTVMEKTPLTVPGWDKLQVNLLAACFSKIFSFSFYNAAFQLLTALDALPMFENFNVQTYIFR